MPIVAAVVVAVAAVAAAAVAAVVTVVTVVTVVGSDFDSAAFVAVADNDFGFGFDCYNYCCYNGCCNLDCSDYLGNRVLFHGHHLGHHLNHLLRHLDHLGHRLGLVAIIHHNLSKIKFHLGQGHSGVYYNNGNFIFQLPEKRKSRTIESNRNFYP